MSWFLVITAFVLMFGLIMVGLLMMPRFLRNQQEQQVRGLARMHKYAKRHNTFVRTHKAIRFVIVLGTKGFHYMVDGKVVSREKLLVVLGKEGDFAIAKGEAEEEKQNPSPTRITLLNGPKKTLGVMSKIQNMVSKR
jgi:hypothetical protein